MTKFWLFIPIGAVVTIAFIMMTYTFFFPRPEYNPTYTITSMDGQVVLCEKGSDEPLIRYEIYTVLLPKADAQTIKNGIDVKNFVEAQSILEDFGL